MNPKEEAGETVITIDAAGCDQYLCYLVVPNSLLLNLSKRAKDGSCLVSCVNEHIIDEAIVLNPECKRFETSIRKRYIENQSRKFKGRKRIELLEGSTRIKVLCGECISALKLKQKTEQTEALDNQVTVVDELVDNLMGAGTEALMDRYA